MSASLKNYVGAKAKASTLMRVYQLAKDEASRPGNSGAWLKVMEMVESHPSFNLPKGDLA